MPSLRKRVSTYLRQLSFHNEPREKRNNVNENAFVTKYLQGHMPLWDGPPIIYGKNPTDLPSYELGKYDSGPNTIIGCYSGPNGGLTTVKRTEKHLSVPDDDIDFIDNPEEEPSISQPMPKKSPKRLSGQPIDNTTMVIKVAGNEYCVTNRPKRHSKSYSLGSIADFNIEVEKTKIDKEFYNCDTKRDENSNSELTWCKENNQTKCDKKNNSEGTKNCQPEVRLHTTTSTINPNTNLIINNIEGLSKEGHLSKEEPKESKPNVCTKTNPNPTKHHPASADAHRSSKTIPKSNKPERSSITNTSGKSHSASLSQSRSDGNPFHHKKRGKIIQVERAQAHRGGDSTENLASLSPVNDSVLPPEWNHKSDYYYGVSDSLYDRNQVTKQKNGDPIADCFGVVARNDSAILAVADGVNWGEKASIAAKSAVHASLHYLNKTIFNDTKPFEKLTTKTDDVDVGSDSLNPDESTNLIGNTREVFVCLLRAFNCAHDLILENKGMLTTLTVAVVLPLKQKLPQRGENAPHYVCCVCNVGDTLAYVYSQRNGIRELTKGSHDVNSNRDMRDALGALGPVDGINPELSNLTLSITTLNKGDIVMVASDGLTDNFDPNVCRFTVNSHADPAKHRVKKASSGVVASQLTTSNQSHSHHTSQQPQSHHVGHLQRHLSQPEQKTHHQVQQSHKNEEVVSQKPPVKPPRRSKNRSSGSSASQSERSASSVEKEVAPKQTGGGSSTAQSDQPTDGDTDKAKVDPTLENPLIAHFIKENSLEEARPGKKPSVVENKASSLRKQATSRQESGRKITPPPSSKAANTKTLEIAHSNTKQDTVAGYKFLKSKTALDLRSSHLHHQNKVHILRNDDGIPYITPIQRYELQLLLMEDILKNGLSGSDSPIDTAKKLCENLVSFTISITAAKRRTLEDQDMYFDTRNGVLVEVSNQEKKMRRKKGLEKVQALPGKLDHVTVVAYNVGNVVS